MNRQFVFASVLVALAVSLGLNFLNHRESVAAPDSRAESKIGILNLRDCFDPTKYEWVKVVDEDLALYGRTLAEDRVRIRKEIKENKERLDGLPEGSKLWFQVMKKIRELQAQLKVSEEVGKVQLMNEISERKIEVFNEVVRVSSLVAKDLGLDFVFRTEGISLDPDERIRESVSSRIRSRIVLYHSKSVDITETVLKKLNEEFRKRPEAKPKPKIFICNSEFCKGKHEFTEAQARKTNMLCPRCTKPTLSEKK